MPPKRKRRHAPLTKEWWLSCCSGGDKPEADEEDLPWQEEERPKEEIKKEKVAEEESAPPPRPRPTSTIIDLLNRPDLEEPFDLHTYMSDEPDVELVMTSCKQGKEVTCRIERLKQHEVDYKQAQHVADGPFKGIVINRPVDDLPTLPDPDCSMEFMVHMQNSTVKTRKNNEKKESRQLRFWFKPQTDESQQSTNAKEYFKALLQPEAFPRDYVGFIKKAILLTQHFPLVKRVEVIMVPETAAENDSGYIDTVEEQVLVSSATPLRSEAPPGVNTTASFSAMPPTPTKTPKFDNHVIDEQEEEEEDEEEEDMENVIQNYITVLTPKLYDYQYLPEVPVSDKHFITFGLKARADGHIALSSVYGDTERKTHEIVIGGWDNTKSVIRAGGMGPIVEEAVTLRILDGYDFRQFWISWDRGMVQVGEGRRKGTDTFLRYKIPDNKKHSVNSLAVSTGPDSTGEWEFVEIIRPPKPEDGTKEARRNRFRLSLLWLAKKQKMLQILEDVYPNPINTSDLLRLCHVKLHDMMTAVVFLKDLQKRGLITEVVKGIWMRSPSAAQDSSHVIKMVTDMPRFYGREAPTMAIITSMYCEKLAVDAMMTEKISYVKYETGPGGESMVYTLGRIGSHQVVSAKLSRPGSGRGPIVDASKHINALLDIFDKLEHIYLVGVGGGVPNFSDFHQHVRRGDIVIASSPKIDVPLYIHCDKYDATRKDGRKEFITRSWLELDAALHSNVKQLKDLYEKDSYMKKPWEKYIEEGKEILHAEESSFHRPAAKTDKLYATVDGELVQVEHPRPPYGYDRYAHDNLPRLRYGPIGSNRYIARNEPLRVQFARQYGCVAFDGEFTDVINTLEQRNKHSYLIIRGIADYEDGSKNKDWQPYASLTAAAYMKALVSALPSPRTLRRSYDY